MPTSQTLKCFIGGEVEDEMEYQLSETDIEYC